MQIIIGKSGQGKTTKLIRLSHEHWYYIVTIDSERAHYVYEQAKDLGIEIPFPITVDSFLRGEYGSRGINGFLFDELLHYFQKRSNKIMAVTIDGSENELRAFMGNGVSYIRSTEKSGIQ